MTKNLRKLIAGVTTANGRAVAMTAEAIEAMSQGGLASQQASKGLVLTGIQFGSFQMSSSRCSGDPKRLRRK